MEMGLTTMLKDKMDAVCNQVISIERATSVDVILNLINSMDETTIKQSSAN